MVRTLNIYFSLFMALAVTAPSLASAFEPECKSYVTENCHGEPGVSETDKSAANQAHHCLINHVCCHSAVHMGKISNVHGVLPQKAPLVLNYIFSINTSILEGPFQPPEA